MMARGKEDSRTDHDLNAPCSRPSAFAEQSILSMNITQRKKGYARNLFHISNSLRYVMRQHACSNVHARARPAKSHRSFSKIKTGHLPGHGTITRSPVEIRSTGGCAHQGPASALQLPKRTHFRSEANVHRVLGQCTMGRGTKGVPRHARSAVRYAYSVKTVEL